MSVLLRNFYMQDYIPGIKVRPHSYNRFFDFLQDVFWTHIYHITGNGFNLISYNIFVL